MLTSILPFRIVLIVCVGTFVFTSQVFAGAALMQAQRAKQMKAQQQAMAEQQAYQQYQQQYQQQVAAQQGAEIQAAQQQMMAQQVLHAQLQQQVAAYVQQQQMNQVEEELAMRYLQQELQQRMAQAQIQQIQQVQAGMMQQAVAAAVQRTVVERALAQRDVEAAKSYLQARNEAIAVYGSQVRAQHEAAAYGSQIQTQAVAAAYVSTQNRPVERVVNEQVRDIVNIGELWKKLDQKGQAWGLLIDNQAKVMTVNEYIERFRQQNIKISQSPSYYAQMIDAMSAQSPAMLERPFREVVQILAIMEYDFDNGMDRDKLAQTVLGDGAYQTNKKRLGR